MISLIDSFLFYFAGRIEFDDKATECFCRVERCVASKRATKSVTTARHG